MFDEYLRALKDRLLSPLVRVLGGRVHPLAISLLAFGVGLLTAVAGGLRLYGLGLGLWGLNRVLDGLDGAVARATHQATDLGAYWDILLDVVVYAAVPIGLAIGSASPAAWVALGVLFGTFYLNAASWMYLSALLERRGQGAVVRAELTSVTMPRGLIGGTETVVLYVLFFLFPHRLPALYWGMAALVGVTVLQRLVWAASPRGLG